MSELFVEWLRPQLDDLQKCSDVEIVEKSKLPKNVCHVCLYKLEMWNDFKVQFIATNKKLHNYFKIDPVPATKKDNPADAKKVESSHATNDVASKAKRQKVEEPQQEVTISAPAVEQTTPETISTETVTQELSVFPDSVSQASTIASESEELLIDDDDLATTQPQSQSSSCASPTRKSRKIEREASTKRWIERKKALIAATGEEPSESDSDNGVSLSPVQKARARADSSAELERRRKLEKALKELQTDLTDKYKVHEEDIVEQRRTRSRRNNEGVQNNKNQKRKAPSKAEANGTLAKQNSVETKNVSGAKTSLKNAVVAKSAAISPSKLAKDSAELLRVQLVDIKSPVKASSSVKAPLPVRAPSPVKASSPVKSSKDPVDTVKEQRIDTKKDSADTAKKQLSDTRKDSADKVQEQLIDTKSSPAKELEESADSSQTPANDTTKTATVSEALPNMPTLEQTVEEISNDDQAVVPSPIEEQMQVIEDADNDMEVIVVDGDDPPPVTSEPPLPANQMKSEITMGNATYVVTTTLTEPADSSAVNGVTLVTNGPSSKSKKKKKSAKKTNVLNAMELQRVDASIDSVTDENSIENDDSGTEKCLNLEVQGMKVETLKKVQMELTTFVNEEIRDRLLDNPDHPKYKAKSIKYKNACDALNNELKNILEKVLRSNYEAEKTPSKNSSKRRISKAFVKAAEGSSVFQPKVRVPRLAMGEDTKISNLHILEGLKRERGIVGPLSRVLGKRQLKLPKKFDDFSVSLKDAFLEEQKATMAEQKAAAAEQKAVAAEQKAAAAAAAARNTPDKLVSTADATPSSVSKDTEVAIVEPSSPPPPASLDSSIPQLFSPMPQPPSSPPPQPDVVVLDSDSGQQDSSSVKVVAQQATPKTVPSLPVASTTTVVQTNTSEAPTLIDLDPDVPDTTAQPELKPTEPMTKDVTPQTTTATTSQRPKPKKVVKTPTTPVVLKKPSTPRPILPKPSDSTPTSTKTVTAASGIISGTPKGVSNAIKKEGTPANTTLSVVSKLSKAAAANSVRTPKPIAVSTPVHATAPTKLTAVKVPTIIRKSTGANNSTPIVKTPTPTPKVGKNVIGVNAATPAKRQRHICGICGEELYSKEAAEAHVKNHNVDSLAMSSSSSLGNEKVVASIAAVTTPVQKTKPKLMRCKRCQAIVEAMHVKTHVCNSVKFNCTLCDCSFGVEHLLKAHIDTHNKKKSQLKAIPTADREKQKHARIPDNSHSKSRGSEQGIENNSDGVTAGKNSRNYTCFVCDKVFIDEEQMKDHLQMHCEEVSDDINEKSGFQCAFCGEKFQSEESLENHVSKHLMEDGDEKIKLMINLETQRDRRRKTYFKCDQCDETFSTPLQLAMHLPIHEEEEAAMDEEYEKEQNLVEEETTEHYVCTICDEMFDSQDELSEHLDVHNGNSHVCILCEKPFSNIKDLQEHVSTHL